MIELGKFRLASTDARGGGTRVESLKEPAWEAILGPAVLKSEPRVK